MMWHSLGEFLDMGGYGFYVWGAYGVTALVMALELLWLRRAERAPEADQGEDA